MKTHYCLLPIAACLAASSARGQFPNFPAADRVLGAPNFTTVGTGAATPSGMVNPSGLAIDPLSGKLFVSSSGQNRVLRFSHAATLDNGADAETVFGQVDFSSIGSGSTASTLNLPYGLHVDGSGRLWVADTENNRVLMFPGASTLPGFGSTPDRVFGQPDFTTVTQGTTDSKMWAPTGVYVDAADNLWVADYFNNRVLKFANVSSLPSGAAASVVLGQPDFTGNIPGVSDVKMHGPAGVTVDAAGRLWVADYFNHRVLRFDHAASLGNEAPANGVLGQPDFTMRTPGTTAQTMNWPSACVVDAAGTLYLTDFLNNRVLFFKNAASKANGAAADGVIGQSDFTTNTPDTTERKLHGPLTGLALDGAGRLWIAEFNNNRVLRFSPDPPADRSAAPPTVTGRAPRVTPRAQLVIRGTAADPSGIAQVRYRVGKGAFRPTGGTTSWRFTARLKPRKNNIEIVAVDTLGNVSPATKLQVTRKVKRRGAAKLPPDCSAPQAPLTPTRCLRAASSRYRKARG